jgi:hypothetical protein
VEIALGGAVSEDGDDSGSVLVDFPWVQNAGQFRARIHVLNRARLNSTQDVAILDLDATPDGCQAAQFSSCEDLHNHAFQAYGYAEGYETGVWSCDVIGHDIGTGLLQMTNNELTGKQVQPGFSGGAVWDDQLQRVVGIIVTSDDDSQVRTSFLIPTRLLLATYGSLVGSVLTADQDLISAAEQHSSASVGEHSVVIKELPDGRLVWRGGIGPAQVGHLWHAGCDFKVAFEPPPNNHRGVMLALLRIALHGTGGDFYVADPQRWADRARECVNRCLGTEWNRGSPAVGPSDGHNWGLQPVGQYKEPDVAFEGTYTSGELETLMHANLDLHLLGEIRDLAYRVLCDLEVDILNLRIERNLAHQMWAAWQDWYAALRGDHMLLSHFFRVALARVESSQYDLGRIRAGLKTLTPCLFRGIMFALAIRVCLPKEFIPTLGQQYENLKAPDGMGHLCGLKLIESVIIDQEMGKLSWKTDYVFLPHYTGAGEQIPILLSNLMEAGECGGRFVDAEPVTPLFFTNEAAFSAALGEGAHALREHLLRVVDAWKARQQKEIERAVGVQGIYQPLAGAY